jgi:hypothetical protein
MHVPCCVLCTVCCVRHTINLVSWFLCLSLSLDVCNGCAYCHVKVKSNPKSIHVSSIDMYNNDVGKRFMK